jgi:hypothetical protein
MNPGAKNNFYISLGVWLMIIPLLGIPNVWRGRLVEVTGALVVGYAAWPFIFRKISQKPRVKKEKKEDKPSDTPPSSLPI